LNRCADSGQPGLILILEGMVSVFQC
jgi:hypothetical protein